MRRFLREYGFAILCAIAIIVLIVIVGPTGNLIQNKMEFLIEKFALRVDSNLIRENLNKFDEGDNDHKEDGKIVDYEDLKDTTWELNDTISYLEPWYNEWNSQYMLGDYIPIQFTRKGSNEIFTTLILNQTGSRNENGYSNNPNENVLYVFYEENYWDYEGAFEKAYDNGEWLSDNYRTITIKESCVDEEIISWFKSNARLINGDYEKQMTMKPVEADKHVTSLTNTKWTLDTQTLVDVNKYPINKTFALNGNVSYEEVCAIGAEPQTKVINKSFDSIVFDNYHVGLYKNNVEVLTLYDGNLYDNNVVLKFSTVHVQCRDVVMASGWNETDWSIETVKISVTGGGDNSNDELITWLENSAVKTPELGTFYVIKTRKLDMMTWEYIPVEERVVEKFAYEPGMTWEEWIESEYNYSENGLEVIGGDCYQAGIWVQYSVNLQTTDDEYNERYTDLRDPTINFNYVENKVYEIDEDWEATSW